MKEPRPSPAYVPGTDIMVPLRIRQDTEQIVGAQPPGKIVVVAQALHDKGETVVRGAVYWRAAEDLTFVGYVSHNLQPNGLRAGVELRWSPGDD